MKKKNLLGTIVIVILILMIFSIIILINIKNKKLIDQIYPVLGDNDLNYCGGLQLYNDKDVSYKTINDEYKVCNALSKIYKEKDYKKTNVKSNKKEKYCLYNNKYKFGLKDYKSTECEIYKLDQEKVNSIYYNYYGKKIVNVDKIMLMDNVVCYLDNDEYICGTPDKYTITIGNKPNTYRTISKIKEKGSRLFIYDYFLKTDNNKCYSYYDGLSENKDCSKIYNNKINIDYKFIKKYGTLHEHIFEIKEDNYFWLKSSTIKK